MTEFETPSAQDLQAVTTPLPIMEAMSGSESTPRPEATSTTGTTATTTAG